MSGEGKMAGEFEYFSHEGSVFRKPKTWTMSVTHIRNGDSWEPYKGDKLAPVHFDDEVSQEVAERGMK
jgi:hypothetical protein